MQKQIRAGYYCSYAVVSEQIERNAAMVAGLVDLIPLNEHGCQPCVGRIHKKLAECDCVIILGSHDDEDATHLAEVAKQLSIPTAGNMPECLVNASTALYCIDWTQRALKK